MEKRKYPSTPYLPFSPSVQDGDEIKNDFAFWNEEVVVTEKMDGENTTLYRDAIHARSLDSRFHPSRSYVTALHGSIAHMIPCNQRLIVESMYAKHSIAYENLDSYVYGFAVVEDGWFLDWEECENVFDSLGISIAPILYKGIATPEILQHIASSLNVAQQEGFVVRSAKSFLETEFTENVAKWVRPEHVQTDEHWMRNWEPNTLKK